MYAGYGDHNLTETGLDRGERRSKGTSNYWGMGGRGSCVIDRANKSDKGQRQEWKTRGDWGPPEKPNLSLSRLSSSVIQPFNQFLSICHGPSTLFCFFLWGQSSISPRYSPHSLFPLKYQLLLFALKDGVLHYKDRIIEETSRRIGLYIL